MGIIDFKEIPAGNVGDGKQDTARMGELKKGELEECQKLIGECEQYYKNSHDVIRREVIVKQKKRLEEYLDSEKKRNTIKGIPQKGRRINSELVRKDS